ncbi:hypothetical protein GSY71_02565 [Pusillimonas sp. TS35]|nr:hypothetical protein [Pusillimonas sp. TS35]
MGASSLPSTPSDASRISQAPHSSPATEGAPRPAASAPAFSPAQAAARVPPLNPASASDAIPITAPSTLPPPEKRRLMHSVWLWRGATIVFAALALAISLVPKEPLPPPINVVQVAPTRAAILQAPGQSSTPGWIVTFDPQGNVLMSPQVHSDVAPKSAVQLWTYNETVSAPRSLGLIDPNRPITVPAALMGELGKEQYFEMTLEPQGGSPTASPSGPVLFIGRVVTFGAPGTEPVVGGGRPPAASGSAPGSAAN